MWLSKYKTRMAERGNRKKKKVGRPGKDPGQHKHGIAHQQFRCVGKYVVLPGPKPACFCPGRRARSRSDEKRVGRVCLQARCCWF